MGFARRSRGTTPYTSINKGHLHHHSDANARLLGRDVVLGTRTCTGTRSWCTGTRTRIIVALVIVWTNFVNWYQMLMFLHSSSLNTSAFVVCDIDMAMAVSMIL